MTESSYHAGQRRGSAGVRIAGDVSKRGCRVICRPLTWPMRATKIKTADYCDIAVLSLRCPTEEP